MKKHYLSGLLVLLAGACGDNDSDPRVEVVTCSEAFTTEYKAIGELFSSMNRILEKDSTYSPEEKADFLQDSEDPKKFNGMIAKFEADHGSVVCLLDKETVKAKEFVEKMKQDFELLTANKPN